jgi:hypothetical protein
LGTNLQAALFVQSAFGTVQILKRDHGSTHSALEPRQAQSKLLLDALQRGRGKFDVIAPDLDLHLLPSSLSTLALGGCFDNQIVWKDIIEKFDIW